MALFRFVLALLLLLSWEGICFAQDANLALRAVGVLNKYCHQCHGVSFKYPCLDVLDRVTLLEPKNKNEKAYLVPGMPKESRIWLRIAASAPSQRMPPEDQPQPTSDEQAAVKLWIEQGAAYPPAGRPQRPHRGEDEVLAAIAADQQTIPDDARPFTRYFSLLHLWNDPDTDDSQLRTARAAVSKLVNSLSSEFHITTPRLVDANGLVLAIDLRKYGWQRGNRWTVLVASLPEHKIGGYPYGLARSSEEARRVYELTRCELPYVRADWFIYHASRPPLYHDLLGLPGNQKTLEADLGVDAEKNFAQNRVARAAFRESGVSDQARMVQRQDAKFGAYWDSFDNGVDGGDADFFTKPLGPRVPGRSSGAAFKHDGGEVIYHLPNGLLGFYLAKADGEQIAEGPIAIVRDPQQFSGSNAIVNGISCMGCHRQGFIPFTDTLRDGFKRQQGQTVADKVLKIFPPQEQLNRLIDEDRDRYLKALEKACLDFLRTGPDDARPMSAFPEPITSVSKRYDRKLKLADLARELLLPTDPRDAARLGIPSATDLESQFRLNAVFQDLGLEPLARGEVITRSVWEKTYHRTARLLKLGVPYHEGR